MIRIVQIVTVKWRGEGRKGRGGEEIIVVKLAALFVAKCPCYMWGGQACAGFVLIIDSAPCRILK